MFKYIGYLICLLNIMMLRSPAVLRVPVKRFTLFPAVLRFGYTIKLFGAAFVRPTKFWSN